MILMEYEKSEIISVKAWNQNLFQLGHLILSVFTLDI